MVLGAWGAHGLAEVLGEHALMSWQTGVDYQLLHAILLFAIGTKQENGKAGFEVSPAVPSFFWLFDVQW